MKEYVFEFEITGTCGVKVKANSLEEAIQKIYSGKEEVKYENNEWSVVYPDESEAKSHWANRSDFKE